MDISLLEQRAAELLSTFDPPNARKTLSERPFIVELTGTPKSGKGTTKEKLKNLFQRQKLMVAAPEEGAEYVKWAKRLDPEYNLQTGEYALTTARGYAYGPEHKSFHVVIFDRAIYDVVARMEYNRMNGKIDARQQRAIENYFLLDVNRRMFDCHVMLVADPRVAMSRQKAHSLSKKDGETMNAQTLEGLLEAHKRVWKRLRCGTDPKLAWRDTSDESPEETATAVLATILDAFSRRLSGLPSGARR